MILVLFRLLCLLLVRRVMPLQMLRSIMEVSQGSELLRRSPFLGGQHRTRRPVNAASAKLEPTRATPASSLLRHSSLLHTPSQLCQLQPQIFQLRHKVTAPQIRSPLLSGAIAIQVQLRKVQPRHRHALHRQSQPRQAPLCRFQFRHGQLQPRQFSVLQVTTSVTSHGTAAPHASSLSGTSSPRAASQVKSTIASLHVTAQGTARVRSSHVRIRPRRIVHAPLLPDTFSPRSAPHGQPAFAPQGIGTRSPRSAMSASPPQVSSEEVMPYTEFHQLPPVMPQVFGLSQGTSASRRTLPPLGENRIGAPCCPGASGLRPEVQPPSLSRCFASPCLALSVALQPQALRPKTNSEGTPSMEPSRPSPTNCVPTPMDNGAPPPYGYNGGIIMATVRPPEADAGSR